MATGETPPAASDDIKFTYVSAEALVVTVDSATSTAPFRVARRVLDDSIDTPGVARVVAQSEVDRSDQRFEEFVASTRPGHVRSIVPGTAPSFTFPRQGLNATRLLIENVSSVLGVGENEGEHAVSHTVRATALDYQGDAGDDLRRPGLYQPPAPRPMTPTSADPDQTIIRPENVATPAQLPIHLGGYPSDPIRGSSFGIPTGALIARVSGHQIAHPLVLTFQGACLPAGSLVSGQTVEVQLWDRTTSAAIGSNIVIDDTTLERRVLRDIALPLREFDLTWRARVTGNLRAGLAFGLSLNLDIG